MFKHILLPTDGSAMSELAIQKGIALAREAGAKISAIHVIPEFHVFAYGPEMVTDTEAQYHQYGAACAGKILGGVQRAADEAGVVCHTLFVASDHPYEAIVKAAQDCGCDLICMASHGRKGVKGVLLGSETQKVLTHTDVPVLVYR
jgi:nucleotide-binding universal stress UspA family protein